jgi:hypothetical protein
VDITTQVIGVSGASKNTSRGPGVIYTISFADGSQAQTWDEALAAKAQGLVGQTSSRRWRRSRTAVHEHVPQRHRRRQRVHHRRRVHRAATIPIQGNGAAAAIPMNPPSPSLPATSPPRGEARIVKQSLLSTSLGFVGQLYSGAGPEAQAEALEAGLTIAKALYAEVMGGQAPAPAPTPQAVAAAVPGVQVGSEDLKTW